MNRKPSRRELEQEIEQLEREIAQLRNTEEAFQKSEEKCRAILAGMEDGYFEVDLSGNLTFFNPPLCKVLGYSEEQLVGVNNRQIMSEKTAKEVFKVFNEVYRTGRSSPPYKWELIARDGTNRSIEISVSLIHDSNGNPSGFRGIGRDLTERKQAEEQTRLHQQQLFHASKMVALGTLVSGVAHEVNNPNNFIMLNTPLLQEAWAHAMPILDEYYEQNGDFMLGGMTFTEIRDYLPKLFGGIMRGTQRIKHIVEELKDFVRMDSSDLVQSVDVNEVLRSAISLVSNMINKATSRFSLEYGENLPCIRGNFQRLEQVLINLIQNACQALKDNQKAIRISTCSDNVKRSTIIKVEDEGMGIAPNDLPRIMDPFFTTRQDSGGIGLGLSISLKIIEEHGGAMNFTSEPGRGTTVEVVLPYSQAICE